MLHKGQCTDKKQFVVVTRRGEDIADIDVGGKRVNKEEFMRSMQFVDEGQCDIMPAITFVGESRQG